MEALLDDPRLWVALALAVFVLLSYKKIAGFMTRSLDDRSAKIKSELDEARRLREEAESVLAQYKQRQAEYAKEAESLLQQAREGADALRAHAEREMQAALATRMKQALERISQEEEKAIADVRNHVVDIALSAARRIIADHVSMSQDEVIKIALDDIERKIH